MLLMDKQVYNFMIIGVVDKHNYVEVYFTENSKKTSIYRGSNVKEVIKLAKKKAGAYDASK
jgi:predicted membrane GTPase involved in stress response